jgi:hypothetical protein
VITKNTNWHWHKQKHPVEFSKNKHTPERSRLSPDPPRGNSSTLPGRTFHVNPQFPNIFGVRRSLVGIPGMHGSPAAEEPARLDTGFGYLTRSDSRAQAPHRPDVLTDPELNLNCFLSVLSVPVRHEEHYAIAREGSKSGVDNRRRIRPGQGKSCRKRGLFRCFQREREW